MKKNIFIDKLPLNYHNLTFSEIPDFCIPFAIPEILYSHSRVIYITNSKNELNNIHSLLTSLCNTENTKILTLPEWDCDPYDQISPNKEISYERTLSLVEISKRSNKNICVLTTIASVLQKIPPRNVFQNITILVKTGESLDPISLIKDLITNGYEQTEIVRKQGEYVLKGGILDIYPINSNLPVRIDFFGDQIETIKTFNPFSQISIKQIPQISLLPTSEIIFSEKSINTFKNKYNIQSNLLYESVCSKEKIPGIEHWLPLFYDKLETIFHYLPNSVIIKENQFEASCKEHTEKIINNYKLRKHSDNSINPLHHNELYLDLSQLNQYVDQHKTLSFSPYSLPKNKNNISLKIKDASYISTNNRVKEKIIELLKTDRKTIIACYSTSSQEHIYKVLKNNKFFNVIKINSWQELETVSQTYISLIVLNIKKSFITPNITLISEQDIFGKLSTTSTNKKNKQKLFINEASSLLPGDLIVHVDHGIGKFETLKTLEISNIKHDFISIIYDKGDRLLVSVENIDVISRYGSNNNVTLDQLGKKNWKLRKKRVKKDIQKIASELIKTTVIRQSCNAAIIEQPEGLYDEFCSRFFFLETEDQLQAIQESLQDLSSGKPMDRLICGDVGYGKTEIALRTAFATAVSGKQIALIAPTTLLCKQHFNTFTERFNGFNFKIAQLSRLVSSSKARQIKEDLKQGKIDIIISTHSILSTSMKNLGLLIIDEEQHFGVKQKEKLKNLKQNVHILTLTATPIPRTLQMALNGVKDLSIISTPPVNRSKIKTFILLFDAITIKNAIQREISRDGQIFYVCPRIKDIKQMHNFITKTLPKIKVATAHGQMKAQELDQVISDFYNNKYDLLLTTNIIESGLDIPSANTLIIHRADMFGLSQLYQLRGRIGRSEKESYAYLTLPKNKTLSVNAQKRLDVMQTLDHIGANFQLANHDLDIRGAGNLLGEEQSGHIKDLGIELYQKMLEDAVTANKNEKTKPTWTPQINIGVPILIPEQYVNDFSVRLELYRRIANLSEKAEIKNFSLEMIDRFGPLHEEVKNLFDVIAIKNLCLKNNIEKIDLGKKGLTIAFKDNQFPHLNNLIKYINQYPNLIKLRPDQKIVFLKSWETTKEKIQGIYDVINIISKLTQNY